MAEHPNAALHRKGHEAFSTGDMATLTELIAEDTLWHTAGRSPIAGDYRGRDAVFEFLAKLAELSEGTMKIQDHDFLASDEHADQHTVALFNITAARAGKTLDANYCEVVHWRDGQVVEDWGFAFDQYAFDEFWS